ncbi:Ppx/GppA phosphatase family protein [Massilia consociata]|uniref:Ppx/GppA phosphatase N-terminal domain-containing protein n=1 Tax=Massilia consociata TaxID=760117 RepID=A0ABV6FG48_9BURK
MTSPDFPRYAAVELGSGSFRLHVGRIEHGELLLEATLAEPVRLAASFDEDGSLCEAAMRRALACLREFALALDAWRPQAVRAVATAAFGAANPMARNAQLFLPAAERALRRPIECINGDEAGRLVYTGVASTLGDGDGGPRLVLDIGSASTELVLGRGLQVEQIESFPVGAVRQSLSFFADGRIDAACFDAAVRSGRSRFAGKAPGERRWPLAWGACGTVRALAEIALEDGFDGGRLTHACLRELRRRFVDAGHVARIRLAWPAAARAPHLAGGLALLLALVEECAIDEVVPAQAGLRVGALWDLHRRAFVATRAAATPGAAQPRPPALARLA